MLDVFFPSISARDYLPKLYFRWRLFVTLQIIFKGFQGTANPRNAYPIWKQLVFPGIILCMHPANERWRYIVTSSLIGWVHSQNDPCIPRSATSYLPYSEPIHICCVSSSGTQQIAKEYRSWGKIGSFYMELWLKIKFVNESRLTIS